MSIATQPLALPRGPLTLVRDYAELTKLRVTTLVVMTAWCSYYFGAIRAGVSSFSWGPFSYAARCWPGGGRHGRLE